MRKLIISTNSLSYHCEVCSDKKCVLFSNFNFVDSSFLPINFYVKHYLWTQWAAVIAQFAFNKTPPHSWTYVPLKTPVIKRIFFIWIKQGLSKIYPLHFSREVPGLLNSGVGVHKNASLILTPLTAVIFKAIYLK